MGRLYVGTSGWTKPDFRGRFYPEDLPQRKWLHFMGETLGSIEVNGSFYKLPRQTTVRKWADEMPNGARITLKMWRAVTHYKRLLDPEPKLRLFFDLVNVMPSEKRGAILVQLPPTMGPNLQRLDEFLDEMKRQARGARWHRVVEFRHPDWYTEETFALLDRQRTAICVHDMRDAGPNDQPNDVPYVYMRCHGPGGDTSKQYSKQAVRAHARRVQEWLDEGRTVFVYYNNDVGGHAPVDALAMKRHVEQARNGGKA